MCAEDNHVLMNERLWRLNYRAVHSPVAAPGRPPMRRLPHILLCASFSAVLMSGLFPARGEDVSRYVNVFVGTGGDGHTFPAATVPFGAVQVGPDTNNLNWPWCSGYRYGDSSIMGFSHTHLSGTGIGDMLDVLLMPGTGPVRLDPGPLGDPGQGYRSRFSHQDETAEPGYYAVLLKDYGIRAELSATERAAIHRYTFPASGSSHFIVDLVHRMVNSRPNTANEIDPDASRILDSQISIVNEDTLTGSRRTSIWASDRHLYFVMKFSKPFVSATIVSAGRLQDGVKQATSRALKCLVSYNTSAGETVQVKVGISAVSIAGAIRNLEREIPDWDFERVRRNARAAWTGELSRVQVEDSNRTHKEIFYTSLYHSMLAPTLFDDTDGQYRGMDGKVHELPPGAHNYSTFSLWDTYRGAHPLFTLTQGRRVPEMVNCLIRMAQESPTGMPVWVLAGSETGCMTGYHSAPVIAEAAVKGFPGIDLAKVYPLLKKRALEDDYRGLGLYRKLGYIPCDREPESATKTLEYSYDDWAIAQVARLLGHKDDYRFFLHRSGNYRNLFDKSAGFIRPRLEDGRWGDPFDPKSTGISKKWRDFTESNSWQGTWAAQHDPMGTLELLGGRSAFIDKLDALFNQSSEINGEVPVDMAGLVGMYAHGNEPSHHIAYLYAYAGAPYKTQERVRSLMESMYANKPDGMAGNEDCGQMSAWYILSALGFYPVDPVSGNYVFGSPLFEKVTLNLGGGRLLRITARRRSEQDFYIQSVTLNRKSYTKAWFPHSAIAAGGEIVFEMGKEPNRRFGVEQSAAPPSMSSEVN